jgi:hypothetical protein
MWIDGILVDLYSKQLNAQFDFQQPINFSNCEFPSNKRSEWCEHLHHNRERQIQSSAFMVIELISYVHLHKPLYNCHHNSKRFHLNYNICASLCLNINHSLVRQRFWLSFTVTLWSFYSHTYVPNDPYFFWWVNHESRLRMVNHSDSNHVISEPNFLTTRSRLVCLEF